MSKPIEVKPNDLVEIEVTVRVEDSHGDHRKTARSKIGFRCETGSIPRESWNRLTTEQSEYLLQQLTKCQ